MNIFSIRSLAVAFRVMPIAGVCWLGTCDAHTAQTAAPSSTVTAVGHEGSPQAVGSSLDLIYGQLLLIDNRLLQLVSLETTFCEQRADVEHRLACEAALRDLQRQLQDFNRSLMPRTK